MLILLYFIACVICMYMAGWNGMGWMDGWMMQVETCWYLEAGERASRYITYPCINVYLLYYPV